MYEGKSRYEHLRISPADIYEQMGYGRHAPDDDTRRETEQVAEHVRRMLTARFCFVICEGRLDERENTLTIEGQQLNIGRIIARQLRGSEAFALFVATSGREFELLQKLFKQSGDLVKTFIADAMGSVIAEKTADCMEECLENTLLNGITPPVAGLGSQLPTTDYHHTNRFSPGYCGWHVSEQRKLFSLFPVADPCGVHLTESSLMLPIKSVSGVIGIGRNVKKLDYTCGLCDYTQCFKRKKQERSHLKKINNDAH